MTAFARHFESTRFNFDTKQFDRENDTARPIFYKTKKLNPDTDQLEEVEMVKVTAPGETLNIFGGKVTDEHKMRWADQYERFKRGEEQSSGVPLSQWPEVQNDVDFIDQMRAFRIYTVEDMAKMNDGALRLFHGAREWRKKAQVFLEEHNKTEDAKRIAASEADKDAKIAELQRQMAELNARMAAPQKKKPGRKPKVQAEPVPVV